MSTPWPENPKFCKDCKWYYPKLDLCECRSCDILSLVTGNTYPSHAVDARKPSGICGIEARYFNPKEQKL